MPPKQPPRKRRRDEDAPPLHDPDPAELEDEEEPEGEDLYGDNYLRDYTEMDEEMQEGEDDEDGVEDEAFIDDGSVSEMSEGDRREVDEMLERRQLLEEEALRTSRRVPVDHDEASSNWSGESDHEDDDEDTVAGTEGEQAAADDASGAGNSVGRSIRSGVHHYDTAAEDAVYSGDATNVNFDWTKPPCELHDWLTQEVPRRVIKNRIFHFFRDFAINGVAVYPERVRLMTRENSQSLEVSYTHLSLVYHSVLVLWLADLPEPMFELFDEALHYFVFRTLYPNYRHVHEKLFVRISEMPLCDPIRDFRQVHMNVLVRVEGVVIRRSPVYPQMQAVRYDCTRCGFLIGPIFQRSDKEHKVSLCPSCHGKGPFRVNMSLTEYRNHQTIVLQEPPGKVPPGRLPRSLEVILTDDLIDRAKPGEEVDVTGVYKNNFDPLLNSRQGFPVFTTVLQANNVKRRTVDSGAFRLPEDEKRRILELSQHPSFKKKLLRSIAPSIHGREDIKLGLLLAMLGGVPKDVGGDHKIRGDINVLLVGDPGCAKSQFLKFVEKTTDRAVFTTGRGSTAVGLTASVSKDPITGDFMLEGGALVIADRGVCLIDEFDKMSDQDRTSIHEAMEQQTISIARGGIVTTLSARCCVMAAANPIGGRYDPAVAFDANVNLTTPIVSRFDLIFVVRDEVHPDADEALATFICKSHQRNHPLQHQEAKEQERALHERIVELRSQSADGNLTPERRLQMEAELTEIREALTGRNAREDDDPLSPNPLPQRLVKNYILFAKSHCTPRITNVDSNTIAQLYAELRQESKHGGIPITVRHMESIIRLSEAHARLFLREYVRDEDLTAAIALFLRCFLQTQKYSLRSTMEKRFRKYMESDTEPLELIHHHLRNLVRQARVFELQMYGREPAVVKVDCAELDAILAGVHVSSEALAAYYTSADFTAQYVLIRDPLTKAPVQIEHHL